MLNDLEIVMKLKRTRPLDTRTDEHPYSSLSFHVDQLAILDKKPPPRIHSAKSRTLSLTLSEFTDNRTANYRDSLKEEMISSVDDEEDDYTKHEMAYGEEDENEELSGAEVEKTPVEAKPMAKGPMKSVSYSDKNLLLKYNSANELLVHGANRMHNATMRSQAQPAYIDINRRPHTAPYRLNPSDTTHAPAEPRPTSAVNTVEHRRKCYIPGPHTIDTENAYSVVRGPHAHVKALLGPPEAPRYSAITRGIQHSSAWYHVKGRYGVPSRPYAPKRSQKRILFKSNGRNRSGSRGSSHSCPDYRVTTPLSVVSGIQPGVVRG